jgi:hypothetical protein
MREGSLGMLPSLRLPRERVVIKLSKVCNFFDTIGAGKLVSKGRVAMIQFHFTEVNSL